MLKRLVAITLAYIALLVILVGLAWHLRVMRQLERELERLRKAGEPTRWEDIAPPIPKHLDGTPLLLKAIEQLHAAQQKIPPNIWKTYNAQVLEAARPALKTLRQALAFPHWRLVDPKQVAEFEMPDEEYKALREFARLLRAEALQRKRKGDVDGALESCQTILKLCRHMDDEPYLFAFLVQKTIFSIGVVTLWEGVLSDADASATAYRAVLAELRAWDIDRAFVRALKGERVVAGILVYDFFRRKVGFGRWLLSTWIAANQSLTLAFYRQLLPIAQKGVPYDRRKISRLIANFKRRTQGSTLHFATMLADLLILTETEEVFDRVTETHALQRVTEVALALRLYRKEHGRYPEDLQALVPKFLPSVPSDPYDGKPLRYRKLQKGFKVWSVGENRKDDGGVKVRDWLRRGDLVLESKL
ncbi:MAG: hypothetical protein OXFUSZZB_002687 [Candidatus Fervidibacter sp.]|jgi:hypothetical protein